MTAAEAILWALTAISPEAVEARAVVQAALPVEVVAPVYYAAPQVRTVNC